MILLKSRSKFNMLVVKHCYLLRTRYFFILYVFCIFLSFSPFWEEVEKQILTLLFINGALSSHLSSGSTLCSNDINTKLIILKRIFDRPVASALI